MKHKLDNNYEKYVKSFNKTAKKLKINTNTFKGQEHFGKACNYYINKKRYEHKTNKSEHLRHTIFIIIKIIWTIAFSVYIFFYFFPSENFNSDFLKKLEDGIENIFIIFTGVVLCYFFFPIFPKPVLSNTDYLISFSGGIILILLALKNLK
tara:strand:- start:225 stop:677 length:453 start_codon:yes stop_codon:yes gene_type:complete